MSELIDILGYSTGSLFWGFFIGATCLFLFFFLIKGWYKDAMFTPATYCVGALLGLLLVYQSTLACGAFAINRAAQAYEEMLTAYVQTAKSFANMTDEVTSSESDELCKQLIAANPLLSHYIGGADFRGYSALELPHAMIQELNSVMRWYIFRRILWSLAFVIVGAFAVIKTMERGYKSQRARRPIDRVSRSNHERVRTRRR